MHILRRSTSFLKLAGDGVGDHLRKDWRLRTVHQFRPSDVADRSTLRQAACPLKSRYCLLGLAAKHAVHPDVKCGDGV